MPVFQTEGYFENSLWRFLEEPVLFLLVLNRKSVLRQKDNSQLKFCRNICRKEPFIFCIFDESRFSNIYTLQCVTIECIELNECVNIRKSSEVAKLLFQ